MKNKKLVIIIAAIAIAVIAISIISMPNIKTKMALSDKIEDKSVHRALIIRNENVVKDESGLSSAALNNMIQTHVSDGEYVKRYKNVATMYKNGSSEETAAIGQKLAKVIDRINQITSSKSKDAFLEDVSKLELNMSEYVRDMAKYSIKRDVRSLSSVKSKMEIATDKKNSADGEKIKKELEKLNKEKQGYEKSLENLKIELYSPSSGIFSAKMDGYEEILTANSIDEITVDDFERIYKEDKENNSGCKIIDNYQWYAAIEVDKKRAAEFKEGEQVFLRFSTINKDFTACIESISKAKSGKNIICISSDEYDVDISTLRKTDITLIKNIFSGLKIPSEAIKQKDGKTGVYAIKGKTVTFVETVITYNDGENAIVKEYNPFVDEVIPAIKLELYDEVIVSGRNIYDGMVIKWGNLIWI